MSTAELTVMNADTLTADAFQIDTAVIKAEAEQYALLTINGIDDKEGFRSVKEGRLKLKKVRTSIENRRKELKAGALEYGRKVDAVAKELTDLIEPAEKTLAKIESDHVSALEAIEQKKLDDRMEKLAAVRFQHPASLVKSMNDKQFEEFLATATTTYTAAVEAERVAAEKKARKEAEEAEARRIEDERLKAEREALERERQELAEQRRKQEAEDAARCAEEQAALKAEQDKIDAERREIARQQAEIDAANAERERIEREQREAEQRALQEADRLRLIEESKTDRQKLQKVIDTISNLRLPQTTTVNGQAMADFLDSYFGQVVDKCEAKLNELLPAE